MIFLNDWALGEHFSGRAGFEAELARQGFVNVRNVCLADRADLQKLMQGKKQGTWGGTWQTRYAWEPDEYEQPALTPIQQGGHPKGWKPEGWSANKENMFQEWRQDGKCFEVGGFAGNLSEEDLREAFHNLMQGTEEDHQKETEELIAELVRRSGGAA